MSILADCSFHSEDSPSDQVGIGNTIIPLGACRRDVKPLLKSIGASGRGVVNRNVLTTDWAGRKNDKCTYPSHEGPKKKLANPRRATAAMSIEIYEIHGRVVPIGSGENALGSLKLTVNKD